MLPFAGFGKPRRPAVYAYPNWQDWTARYTTVSKQELRDRILLLSVEMDLPELLDVAEVETPLRPLLRIVPLPCKSGSLRASFQPSGVIWYMQA